MKWAHQDTCATIASVWENIIVVWQLKHFGLSTLDLSLPVEFPFPTNHVSPEFGTFIIPPDTEGWPCGRPAVPFDF